MGFTPQVTIGRVAPAVDLQEPARGGRRVQSMQQADSRTADACTPEPYSPGPMLYPPSPVTVSNMPVAEGPGITRERQVQNMARMHSMQEMKTAASKSNETPALDVREQRRTPKRQSMQDLPRRNFQLYQPYVENETDIGRELGGEV